MVHEAANVVLMSDVLRQMFLRGIQGQCLCNLNVSLQEWWRREDDEHFLAFFRDHHDQLPWDKTFPLVFHEDAVPNYHDETATLYSWGCPLLEGGSWISRNAIIAIPSSRMNLQTRQAVVDVIAWDVQSLLRGCYPHCDHKGVPFPPNSKRAGLAGTPIMGPFRACFAFWKGDMEAHKLAHRLDRHYNKAACCDLDFAHSNVLALSYGDFSPNAYWRTTMDASIDQRSPWNKVPGFSKHRKLFDSSLATFVLPFQLFQCCHVLVLF